MTQPTDQKVHKKVLENGLTILVRPTHTIPKVSIQLWYNVGSKDEKANQKGIAHLIEHMIFKGTSKLSESDINMITHKLSGSCNAFTSYDYTGYMFDFPSQHWHEALPIMADCMSNCLFDQEHLNSEMKAVIQELKMYRDNYSSSIVEHLISAIFTDHPYHYPIIGFKQDLWDLKSETLHDFYKKHYIPNNATLVVVGDVDVDDAFARAQENFGAIPANWDYKKETFYHNFDVGNTSVTLYRDIQRPMIVVAFEVPGARQGKGALLDILSLLLGSGKGSRLQRKLIDELNLVTELETFVYDLFDQGVFFIYFQPINNLDVDKIIDIIQQEINDLAHNPLPEQELQRAINQAQVEYLSILENNQKQAYLIGQNYLATEDDQSLFNYLNLDYQTLAQTLQTVLKNYCNAILMHRAAVQPLQEHDKDLWRKAQQESDQLDARILSNIKRENAIAPGVHVNTIEPSAPQSFNFPQAQSYTLPNGLTVLYYHNPNVATIELYLNFKAKSHFDLEHLQGLHSFTSAMMQEGTSQYNAIELAQAIEQYGMSIDTHPGFIKMSMLSKDLPEALRLLQQVVQEATFPQESIEKIRTQMIADIENLWDNPTQFCNQLARQAIYQEHPYSKNPYGTFESIKRIGRQELVECYQASITPVDSCLAIVGDLANYDVQKLITELLGSWQGPAVKDLVYPALVAPTTETIEYHINRDQVVLAFAGLSINRYDPAFDGLLLFDQVFTGGVLGSMSSRLFALREQSGLFYTISGSLLTHTDKQPGMSYIKTIVSPDRLKEAQNAILETMRQAPATITEQELTQAKNALINSMVDNFETNKHIAASFIFLHTLGLPRDYFNTRAGKLAQVSLDQVQTAAQGVLGHALKTLKIGRF